MATTPATDERVRTAVVIVHGMGEQVPMETVNLFVRTALPRSGTPPQRRYFSRPDRVAGSYEARRLLAYEQEYRPTADKPRVHDHFDFFEYHWSYKMTGNRISDFLPVLLRMLWRLPRTVPAGLKVVWWIAWALILVTLAVLVAFVLTRDPDSAFSTNAVLTFVLLALSVPASAAVASIVIWLAKILGSKITSYFVDVARYLDRSPRSYAVRRDIRDGMVSLLRGLHEQGTYQRIVVVAHSLGGYIAYDGITSLWSEYYTAHRGRPSGKVVPPLEGRRELEIAGAELVKAAEPFGWDERQPGLQDPVDPAYSRKLERYREKQFELWKGLRMQGNPWLITDFITLGTPMYFADLLYTKRRAEFRDLVHRAELPVCPPVPQSQMVEATEPPRTLGYTYESDGRWVLYHAAPFAVTRWTNLYFPAERGFFGDWFGGPLRGLFGPGILDIPITGNLPSAGRAAPDTATRLRNRRTPGAAHGYYFSFAEQEAPRGPGESPHDVAPLLKRYLRLTIEDELCPLLNAPPALPETFPPSR